MGTSIARIREDEELTLVSGLFHLKTESSGCFEHDENLHIGHSAPPKGQTLVQASGQTQTLCHVD